MNKIKTIFSVDFVEKGTPMVKLPEMEFVKTKTGFEVVMTHDDDVKLITAPALPAGKLIIEQTPVLPVNSTVVSQLVKNDINIGTNKNPNVVLKADIMYIQGDDNYCTVFLQNAKPQLTKLTLNNLLQELGTATFCRVHKSYIVSRVYIKELVMGVRRKQLIMTKGDKIPVGDAYKNDFEGWY